MKLQVLFELCEYLFVLVATCTFLHKLLMLNISFGCCRHSVSNTFVQLTEGRSARDQPKQPPAKKKRPSQPLICSRPPCSTPPRCPIVKCQPYQYLPLDHGPFQRGIHNNAVSANPVCIQAWHSDGVMSLSSLPCKTIVETNFQ